MDNNDSVNIFNKYQTSGGPLSDPFSSYFRPKRHGCFRKSVPTMPLLFAFTFCILNWLLPGSGTFPHKADILLVMLRLNERRPSTDKFRPIRRKAKLPRILLLQSLRHKLAN